MYEQKDEGSQGGSVPALRRTVQILDLIARHPNGLMAADIVRQLRLPKSSVHGLLLVMTELDLLMRLENGGYLMGTHVLQWAGSFRDQADISAVFNRYFSAPNPLDAYTVTLSIRDRGDVVYINCRNSDQPLGYTFRIGMRLPAVYTATGKVLLSELPKDVLGRLFGDRLPAPLTKNGVPDMDSLKRELVAVKDRGFSIDDGEVRLGMVCVGAGIRDFQGRLVAGIAASVSRAEVTEDDIAQLGNEMRAAAQAISALSGAVPQ